MPDHIADSVQLNDGIYTIRKLTFDYDSNTHLYSVPVIGERIAYVAVHSQGGILRREFWDIVNNFNQVADYSNFIQPGSALDLHAANITHHTQWHITRDGGYSYYSDEVPVLGLTGANDGVTWHRWTHHAAITRR